MATSIPRRDRTRGRLKVIDAGRAPARDLPQRLHKTATKPERREHSAVAVGAYFPDWLFCIVGGVLLVVCVHVLLSRSGRGAWLTPPAVVYPALTVLFSIALWVAGFNL